MISDIVEAANRSEVFGRGEVGVGVRVVEAKGRVRGLLTGRLGRELRVRINEDNYWIR